MYNVNLDLLKAMSHHPGGQPRDPHAHHLAEHLAVLRAEKSARWQDRFRQLRGRLASGVTRIGQIKPMRQAKLRLSL